jgi:hypothetical protein
MITALKDFSDAELRRALAGVARCYFAGDLANARELAAWVRSYALEALRRAQRQLDELVRKHLRKPRRRATPAELAVAARWWSGIERLIAELGGDEEKPS